MVVNSALRMLGLAIGGALYFFLVWVLARKRRHQFTDRLALAAAASLGIWHVARFAALFHALVSLEGGNPQLLTALNLLAGAGLAFAPIFTAHFAVAFAGQWKRAARWAYIAALASFLSLVSGRLEAYFAILIACCVAAAISLLRMQEHRMFARAFTVSLAFTVVGALAGPDSALPVFASLAPAACMLWFIYRENLLGVTISHRIVFAVAIGIGLSAYVLIARRVADVLDREFQLWGGVIEIAFLLAAASVWIPLYGWMNRFLSRRNRLLDEFSRTLTHQAAAILELGPRLEYIGEQVRRVFRLRRVLVTTPDGPLDELAEDVRARRLDGVVTSHPIVEREGFNYLFPLWYEDRLVGLLLADSSPRAWLDEDEAVLLGLSRQISHLIEGCRLVEEKINLERAVLRQEHLAALGSAAATIAHEVRNPLSTVKVLAQHMSRDETLDPRYLRDLSYIVSETDRLSACVQQLLAFSRPAPETGKVVELRETVENIARTLNQEYASRRIRVEPQVEGELKLKSADHHSLHQIVLNLALNAVQASSPDGIVRLAARALPDSRVSITVTDQGPGVPAEMREKIFEPFVTTKLQGTGLGLAIVKKNVRQLGGEVRLDSPIANGRGTAITVIIPAA